VVKLDHFCPWVNNAVGIQNHKHFLLFCFWTCAQCAFSAALLVSLIADCGPGGGSDDDDDHDDHGNGGPTAAAAAHLRGRGGALASARVGRRAALAAYDAQVFDEAAQHAAQARAAAHAQAEADAAETGCGRGLGLLTLLLFFEALLFGLFTLCMLCDQYAVLSEGTTKIARLKGDHNGAVSKVKPHLSRTCHLSISALCPLALQ
jgi:hypothetical protein